MNNIRHLKRLEKLHQRIKSENTGTPLEMAQQMNVSERSLYNLIEELKIMGADICFSRTRRTYCYCSDFDLELSVSVKVITKGTAKKIYGGRSFFEKKCFPASFLQ
ncbi:MAG: Uncharacterised protein [Formosa sp. Hel3_A1_48]|nr:MAG: Uncharacterised protein [Formosa sp. Hel3_A1_48]